MKKLGILLAVMTIVTSGLASAQESNISRAQLEQMFAEIEANTAWDITGNMLWGYFFTSPNRSELEKIATELVGTGYRLVEIRKYDKGASQEAPEWVLHMERVERQSIDTLSARNDQLAGLASRHLDVVYDGMDVGPAN